MFRKIVSNLAFSPALVGQLGFYARRLRREEATRRLGLVFTALALVVQSLTVFTPPESANASNASDFINGGAQSKKEILAAYDSPRSDFKDIMDYAGITRAELANMTDKSINSRQFGTGEKSVKTWGRSHVFSAAQGEVRHVVPRQPEGGTSIVYSKPLWRYDSTAYTTKYGSTYAAFVGHSKVRGWFAIAKDCGNLITQTTPQPHVNASFISTSCDAITGKAIDTRDRGTRIKVFLYFDGPPGKGKKYGPIYTNAKDNKFSFKVPEKYRTSDTATKVWGVMIPLAGWHDSTVQFDNTVKVPGGCVKPEPLALCSALTKQKLSRTDFNFTAKATVKNGANVSRYDFIIRDSNKNKVAEKSVESTKLSVESGRMTISEPGTYTVRARVQSSVGEKTSADCVKTFTVLTPGTPSVEIEKLVDGTKQKEVAVGEEFEYQIAVTNNGEVALTNVAVTDTPPAGVTLVSTALGTISANKWSYTIPSLRVGETKQFTIKAKVNAYKEGSLKNTACVNANEVNPSNPAASDDCDDATVTVTPPDVCEETEASCANVTESKTAKNLTQNIDATTEAAQASDRIEYTIYLENIGSQPTTHTVSESLGDVLEYSTLTQNGGGSFNESTKVLSWGDVQLKPGEKATYSFVVTMKDTIPTMARGQSEPSSFDCVMLNSFGNTVKINVACTTPKIVEQTIEELPSTGPGENMLFAGVVGAVVTFFYARSRQLGKEVKLIRKDFNMGTI